MRFASKSDDIPDTEANSSEETTKTFFRNLLGRVINSAMSWKQ